jgi:vacuolar protein-sorting-associated protein 4
MRFDPRWCALHCWLQVVPPIISMRDFDKVLERARPTVSFKDLEVFERFTEEFGEEAS